MSNNTQKFIPQNVFKIARVELREIFSQGKKRFRSRFSIVDSSE